MRNTALFQPLRSLQLSQGQIETVEGTRGTDDDDTARPVDETDVDLAVFGEMTVCLFDVLVDDGGGQVADPEHGAWVAFLIGEGVGEDGGWEGCYGEGDLGAQADAEEDGDCIAGLSEEGGPIG
jgi:hypothetical protein